MDHVPFLDDHFLNGTDAVALVELVDTDLRGLPEVAVEVEAIGLAGSRETIPLYPDSSDPTAFYGTFGVEWKTTVHNGRVTVRDGYELQVTYQDEGTGAEVIDAGLFWAASTSGTLQLDRDEYHGDSTAVVTVIDADRNMDVTKEESIPVQVYSMADPTGFALNLTEVDEDSARFEGRFRLSNDPTVPPPLVEDAGEGKFGSLEVTGEDRITVYYLEDHDITGRARELTTIADWTQTHGASINFTGSGYRFTSSAPYSGLGGGLGFLRLEDQDQAGSKVQSVVVSSSDDPVGLPVSLHETGPATGEFVGSFGFTAGLSNPSRSLLHVADGSSLAASYNDDRSADGTETVVTAEASWYTGHTGELRFMNIKDPQGNDDTDEDPPAYTGPADRIDAGRGGLIELQDSDLAGLEEVSVRVTSSRDPVGVEVVLVESTGTLGLFRTPGSDPFSFQLETTLGGAGSDPSSDPPRLLARNGDDVMVSYQDTRPESGRGQATISASVPIFNATEAPEETPGAIMFMAPDFESEALGYIGTGTGIGAIRVIDPNYQLQQNDQVKDVLEVRVGSGEAPVRWDGTATEAWAASFDGGINVSLTETGLDTGVFEGRFGIGDGDGQLPVHSPDDLITAQYDYKSHPENEEAEPSQFDGGSCEEFTGCPADDKVGLGVVQAVLPWRSSVDAALEVGDDGEPAHGLSPIPIVLTGIDAFDDVTDAADTLNVTVRSTTDPTGIRLELRETYAHTDITEFTDDLSFRGTVEPTLSESGPGKIQVSDGDTIEVRFGDPHGAAGTYAERFASAEWKESSTARLEVDQTSYRKGDSALLTVVDEDQSISVPVHVSSGADPEGIIVVLPETGTRGRFSGTLGFADQSDAAAAIIAVDEEDSITVVYQDENTLTGDPSVVVRQSKVLGERTAELTFDHAIYVTESARATIQVDDPDSDQDPDSLADIVNALVFTQANASGELIELHEVSPGLFEGTFGFEIEPSADENTITVQDGDRVTAYYYDHASEPEAEARPGSARTASVTWHHGTNQVPVIAIDAEPGEGTVPLEAEFTLTAIDVDGQIVSWVLDYGDNTSNGQGTGNVPETKQHLYGKDGEFVATLTVMDDLGGTSTASVFVVVNTQVGTESETGPQQPGDEVSTQDTSSGGEPDPVEPSDVARANQGLQATVDVVHVDGDNIVTWDLGAVDHPATPGGVQILRSTSPYRLIATVEPGDASYRTGSYTDRDAPTTARYLVTAFYGDTPTQGFLMASDEAETLLPGFSSYSDGTLPHAAEKDSLSWVLLSVIALAVLVAIVFGALLVRKRSLDQRKEEDPWVDDEAGWQRQEKR